MRAESSPRVGRSCELGGADDCGTLNAEAGVGVAARIGCDHGLSMQLVDGELEQGIGVVNRVGANSFDRQGEAAEQGAKQGIAIDWWPPPLG